PAIAAQAASVTMSVVGGAILVLSGVLFFVVLLRGQTAPWTEPEAYRFSVAVRPPRALPAALNGFGLWLGLMVALTIVNYGFPIAHSLATPGTAVPAVKVGERGGPPEASFPFVIRGSPPASGLPRRSRLSQPSSVLSGCRSSIQASGLKASGTQSAVPLGSFETHPPALKSCAPTI